MHQLMRVLAVQCQEYIAGAQYAEPCCDAAANTASDTTPSSSRKKQRKLVQSVLTKTAGAKHKYLTYAASDPLAEEKAQEQSNLPESVNAANKGSVRAQTKTKKKVVDKVVSYD